MTPQKKSRKRQQTPANAASSTQQQDNSTAPLHYDYDTNNSNLSHINETLNLAVLRRYWPDVLTIISIAPYAVLYIFNPILQTWEKSGIEGSLFITTCAPEPSGAERYRVIILNRRGLDNFGAELRSPDDVDVTEEYIIIKGDITEEDEQDDDVEGGPQIYGLWVFAEPEPASTSQMRELSASIIVECASRAAASRKAIAEMETERLAKELVTSQAAVGGQGQGGEAMGRSLSLRELFGQSRDQDAGFSVHSHHGAQQPQLKAPPAIPPNKPTAMFATNPETEFFRTGHTPSNTSTPVIVKNGTKGGSIAVEDLFRSQRNGR